MSEIKFDKPHDPWGEHVDVINPLGDDIPGVQKLRIGPQGDILSEDVLVSDRWDPGNEPEMEPLNPGEGLAILFEE